VQHSRTALPGCNLFEHDPDMERGGSGPQATAGAPQLHSPPDRQGVRKFPSPATLHHVGPCSHCLVLLPPASGRIHPDHPAQGAAQANALSLSKRGTSHSGTRQKNLANQKNGVKDTKVSHTPSGDPTICPCRYLARLVDALSGLPADPALGTFGTATGTSQVTGQEILEAVRQGARWDNLHLVGYDYAHIGTHSLCSRGATRLCLEGFNKDVI
jgi:hypothetical protein